jgi:hypothetical protein
MQLAEGQMKLEHFKSDVPNLYYLISHDFFDNISLYCMKGLEAFYLVPHGKIGFFISKKWAKVFIETTEPEKRAREIISLFKLDKEDKS